MLRFTRPIRTGKKSSTSGSAPLVNMVDLRQSRAAPVREFTRSRTGEDKYPLQLADFARHHKIVETSNSARLRARGRAAVGVLIGFTALGAAWTILTFT